MAKNLGVIYLAFGRPYLAMAAVSFMSLRATNPSVPACIVSNEFKAAPTIKGWDSRIDNWVNVSAEVAQNRLHKTSIFTYSPFEKTLYLDCDTVVVGSIGHISTYLDYFDIAARGSVSPGARRDRNKLLLDGTARYSELPHWNGGVFGFRKSKAAKRFFTLWNERYQALGFKRDQPAMVEAVLFSGCRILSLEPCWNMPDSLGNGLFWSRQYRSRSIVWHYKSDIDRVLANEIRRASDMMFGPDDPTVYRYIASRQFYGPRAVFRHALRKFRGRLEPISAGVTPAKFSN